MDSNDNSYAFNIAMIRFWHQSKITLLFFAIAQLIISAKVLGQPTISRKDSIDIKNQIEGFYIWYIDKARNQRLNAEFNPGFEKRYDGMTTLNFDNYKSILRKYKFSEDFIQTKVNDYKACIEHLAVIPFDKFTKFQDLDDFEDIDCDFGNQFEWIGGMELPYEKVKVVQLTRVNRKKILGVIEFDSDNSAFVSFLRSGNEWKIDNLILE